MLAIYQSSPVNQCNMFVRMNYDTSRVICLLTNSELLIIMSMHLLVRCVLYVDPLKLEETFKYCLFLDLEDGVEITLV